MFKPSNTTVLLAKPRKTRKAQRTSATTTTRCLMLGLEGAGKTTVLAMLPIGEIVKPPVIRLNVGTIKSPAAGTFIVWDVEGSRKRWPGFTENQEVLIWVVDSNDPARFSESKDELHRMLGDDELEDARLLVVANKQDLPGAKSIAEVRDAHDLSQIRGRDWFICGACSSDTSQVTDWLFNGNTHDEDVEPSGDIEERLQLAAQHLLWRTYMYAQKFAGVDYDTGRAVTVGPQAATMPAEVVGRILSFLPMADLVPNGPLKKRFAPVFPQGSWLVNRTFLVCAFTQAAERIARLAIDTDSRDTSESNPDSTFSARTALRALMTTTLPAGLQALHAVTVSLIALAASDGNPAEGAVTMDMRPDGIGACLDMSKAPASVGSMFRVLGLFSGSVEVLKKGGGADVDHAVGAGDGDDGGGDAAAPAGDDDDDVFETEAPKFGVRRANENNALKMFTPIGDRKASDVLLPIVLEKLSWMAQEYAAGTADYLRLKEIIAEVAPEHARADLVVPTVGVYDVTSESTFSTSKSTASAIRTCNFDILRVSNDGKESRTSQVELDAVMDVISGCASGRCRAVMIEGTDMTVLKCGVAAVLEGLDRGTSVRDVAFSLSREGSSIHMRGEEIKGFFVSDSEPSALCRQLFEAGCVLSMENTTLSMKLPPRAGKQ